MGAAALLTSLALAGCGSVDPTVVAGGSPGTEAPTTTLAPSDPTAIPPAIQAALDDPTFADSSIGLLIQDGDTHDVLVDKAANEIYEAGSTTKLYSAATFLDTYGADHTLVTPVHRTGPLTDGVVDGDLVLVASGDQNLGGRGVLDGPIQFVPTDHTYFNLPGAAITPGDPLAGLKVLAAQVVESGVSEVSGDVVVDDRLFDTFTQWEQSPISPIVVNDNQIDVLSLPTEVGQAADLDWRPQVPGWSVRSEVTTVAAAGGAGNAVQVTQEAPGQLVVSGTVEEGSAPVLGGWSVQDPAAFARSAFIAELQAAGVTVNADPTGANPVADLPASYEDGSQVAALTSAPLSETVHLVLKVSHNWGAELLTCMIAVANGSKDCEDGLRAEYDLVGRAGLDRDATFLLDGAGSSLSRFSPDSAVGLINWSTTQPWAQVYRDALPVLGESGDLDLFGGTPADGKVIAKTGTRAVPDPGADRVLMQTRTMVGFIEAKSGRELHFALMVQNVPLASVEDLFAVLRKIVDITVAIYETY